MYFVYFVVNHPRRICRAERADEKLGIWYNTRQKGKYCGTCVDEKIGGDAEAAAREGGDEATGEEGRGAATAFT